ncbi:MAG: SAM-dependent methyltransferase [Verrucomicrobia bacterium]|nr:MAG: SAM-dependent methyltransferase [Verrucomicrobiota bacterium]
MKDEHAQFSGSIPAAYDRYLGPMLFQPYAENLASRLQVAKNDSVLELACGTGILTRVLRTRLPSTAELIATDLNEPMFRRAAAKFRKDEAVQWLQTDACSLPFGDQLFDAVVCQFGIMFVPDKSLAAREAHRVLKPGGLFLFNVWDTMEHNELGQLTHQTIASYFDKDPPAFYEVPFGYHDQDEIKGMLKEAGFQEIKMEVVAKVGAAIRAEDAATGLVHGNPVAVAIAERDRSLLSVITKAAARAIADRFGETDIRAPMRAVVVQARK